MNDELPEAIFATLRSFRETSLDDFTNMKDKPYFVARMRSKTNELEFFVFRMIDMVTFGFVQAPNRKDLLGQAIGYWTARWTYRVDELGWWNEELDGFIPPPRADPGASPTSIGFIVESRAAAVRALSYVQPQECTTPGESFVSVTKEVVTFLKNGVDVLTSGPIGQKYWKDREVLDRRMKELAGVPGTMASGCMGLVM